MKYPMVQFQRDDMAYTNGGPATHAIDDRIAHSEERELPGGANWVVQKFGGTSVGKVAVKIADEVVL